MNSQFVKLSGEWIEVLRNIRSLNQKHFSQQKYFYITIDQSKSQNKESTTVADQSPHKEYQKI
ncbi:hypothetical protein LEP1GSC104_0462 [Leptospira interrogans str. UI 12621]|uniref:Uncharacterized protein n=1 Tax=Leptospira interrogans str. UI 12621 TaxID=1049937 RepID=A0A0F6H943_LEPIR|nr:hypothetical protein LEP1GSC104_0462 [Leptospira interrogans str. UI 12621]